MLSAVSKVAFRVLLDAVSWGLDGSGVCCCATLGRSAVVDFVAWSLPSGAVLVSLGVEGPGVVAWEVSTEPLISSSASIFSAATWAAAGLAGAGAAGRARAEGTLGLKAGPPRFLNMELMIEAIEVYQCSIDHMSTRENIARGRREE